MIIYLVTSGSYSDYSIEGVFSSEDKAKAYVQQANAKSYSTDRSIEEWTVDENENLRCMEVWRCQLEAQSNYFKANPTMPTSRSQRVLWPEGKRSEIQMWGRGYEKVIDTFSAVSPEHAVKLAIEKRQEWLRKTELGLAEVNASWRKNHS